MTKYEAKAVAVARRAARCAKRAERAYQWSGASNFVRDMNGEPARDTKRPR